MVCSQNALLLLLLRLLLLLLFFIHRGVFWDKKSRRWRCQLGHKNRKIFLGYFAVAEEAARAYDQKLVELHGGSGDHICYVVTLLRLLVITVSVG
jgi:hypothetical protein